MNDFAIDALNCAVEVWVPSQENSDASGVRGTCGLHDGKAVARLTDFEIREKYVELVLDISLKADETLSATRI